MILSFEIQPMKRLAGKLGGGTLAVATLLGGFPLAPTSLGQAQAGLHCSEACCAGKKACTCGHPHERIRVATLPNETPQAFMETVSRCSENCAILVGTTSSTDVGPDAAGSSLLRASSFSPLGSRPLVTKRARAEPASPRAPPPIS